MDKMDRMNRMKEKSKMSERGQFVLHIVSIVVGLGLLAIIDWRIALGVYCWTTGVVLMMYSPEKDKNGGESGR